jgi:hypothetical protein
VFGKKTKRKTEKQKQILWALTGFRRASPNSQMGIRGRYCPGSGRVFDKKTKRGKEN